MGVKHVTTPAKRGSECGVDGRKRIKRARLSADMLQELQECEANLAACKAKVQELEAENKRLKESVLLSEKSPPIKRWRQIAGSQKKIKMEMGWRSAAHVHAFLDLLCNGIGRLEIVWGFPNQQLLNIVFHLGDRSVLEDLQYWGMKRKRANSTKHGFKSAMNHMDQFYMFSHYIWRCPHKNQIASM